MSRGTTSATETETISPRCIGRINRRLGTACRQCRAGQTGFRKPRRNALTRWRWRPARGPSGPRLQYAPPTLRQPQQRQRAAAVLLRATATGAPASQVRPERNVQAHRTVGAIERFGEVNANRTDRRMPAGTDTGSGLRLQVEILKSVAAVDEHRQRPSRQDGKLVLGAGNQMPEPPITWPNASRGPSVSNS